MRRPSRRTLLAGVAAALVPLPAFAQTATKEKVAAALPKLGPDGKAAEVTIEDLNEYGPGRLARR